MNAYRQELARLQRKYGYVWARDEDGTYLYNPRRVKPSVVRRLVKLAKYADRADGRPAAPEFYYRVQYAGRQHHETTKQMLRRWNRS